MIPKSLQGNLISLLLTIWYSKILKSLQKTAATFLVLFPNLPRNRCLLRAVWNIPIHCLNLSEESHRNARDNGLHRYQSLALIIWSILMIRGFGGFGHGRTRGECCFMIVSVESVRLSRILIRSRNTVNDIPMAVPGRKVVEVQKQCKIAIGLVNYVVYARSYIKLDTIV